MTGTLYAVGVGPGDPELLTLKAVNTLKAADVIACPAKDDAPGLAYRIAEAACPEIAGKEVLPLDFPMKKGDWYKAHQDAAEAIVSRLKDGKSVAFLTLGDPGFYSTFAYISAIVGKEEFKIEIVSGIPSFCAASAKLMLPIVTGDDPVLITSGEFRDVDGTLIIMKAGSELSLLKEKIASRGKSAFLVENCCMPDERIYSGVDSIPDRTGYFSMLIVK